MVILESENPQLTELNEMFIEVQDSLPTDIEHSIYYPKLKTLLHPEILNFCKEKLDLKADLNFFRMSVGQQISEREIRDYLDGLKTKYNLDDNNIGIDYNIEATRYDFSAAVFCVIKREDIHMKKFIFRFRKANQSELLGNISTSGIPISVDILNGINKK